MNRNITDVATPDRESLKLAVLTLVREHIASDLQIDRNSRLADLEFDSLDLIEIGVTVQEEFGLTVDAGEVRESQTVGDLLDALLAER